MRACNRRLVAATLTAAMLLAMSPAYAAEPDEETLSEQQTVATEATVPEETAPPEETGEELSLLSEMADVEGVYTTWQNAVQIKDGQTASFTLSNYDSSYTADQIWFAVTVPEDNYAIQMQLADVTKSINVYLYDESVLNSAEPGSGNYEKAWGITSDSTYSWKVEHAGIYYLMVRRYNNSSSATYPTSLTVDLVEPDLNENNDTWANATELTRNVNTYYALNGQNDEDWFKITTTVPGEAVKLVLSNFDYTVSAVRADLYTAAEAQDNSPSALTSLTNVKTDSSLSYKINEPGDYYVRIKPNSSNEYVTKTLKVRYETVSGDANELNDDWSSATPLAFDAPVEFTLNGENDEDWFQFETTRSNELVYLSFREFDTDYSNKISYYVYDAVAGGYNSSSITYGHIEMTHTKAITFANTGIHYIRLDVNGKVPVENPLVLTITGGAIDDGEPNDTWEQAVPLSINTPQEFNIPSSTDVDWFMFTVDEADMTVELTFNIPVDGRVFYYLYAGDDLIRYGENTGYSLDFRNQIGDGISTYYCMLEEPGTYYLRVDEHSGFEETATISYTLVPPDNNERNNTWQTATQLSLEQAMSFTLPANNDVDYFKFEATEDNQTVELTFTIPQGGQIYYYLYSGADYALEGDHAESIDLHNSISGGTSSYRCMLGEAGAYYVRVEDHSSNIFDEAATITYRLIQPDEHEKNNTRTDAVALREEVASSFTIPAGNDMDWFQFEATEDYQTVELTLNIPDGGRIYYDLYSAADFAEEGDSAGSIDYRANISGGPRVYRYMLKEAGTYYLRIQDYSGGIFDEEATVAYRLIAPDEYENNNTWSAAVVAAPQTALSLTLPAGNDEDWFKLGEATAGDHISFAGGNVHGTGTLTAELRVLEDGKVSTTYCTRSTASTSQTSFSGTYTAERDGVYYARLYNGGWLTEPMWFRYAITKDDVAVTGVSITNGGVTIAVGQTLQLYGNVSPSNATNQNVTWSSSQPSVAEIDANGLITAKTKGSTTIMVSTADGGRTARTTIHVVDAIPVTDITLTAEGYTESAGTEDSPRPLALGTSLQMTASVVPENATERGITWAVSNEDVLAVTSSGKVYAVGSGKAKVTATTVDGSFTKGYWFSVPDESYPVRGISLNYNAATIYMGESGIDLLATVSPSYATNPAVNWKSDNPDVAAVDQYGHVTPISKGYATITVTAAENPGVQNSCLISVQPERTRVEGISFPETQIALGLYGSVTLQPVFTPANATDQTVTWESSNKAVVTVSRTGVVTAIGLGSAAITATSSDGGYKASVTITVSLSAGYGDVNNDGGVDTADALMVLQNSVGLRYLSEVQETAADVNGDGYVDAADAILILRYHVGLIDSFPVEDK